MVSMEQLKRGVARYLDEEFTNKLSGWQKWVFGAGAALYLENFSNTAKALREHPVVKSLNVIDDNNNVSVERIYQHLKAQAQKGPITFTVPMLGTVTLNEQDVEKLNNCIMRG